MDFENSFKNNNNKMRNNIQRDMLVEKLDVFALETCDYLLPSIFFILDFKIGSFAINIKK